MKKETLKLSQFNKDEIINLFSIVSTESDLQVCYILNGIFQIGLSLADDVIVSDKTNKMAFKKYFYEDEEGNEKYILLINRNNNSYLFPELKKVDYLFIFIAETVPLSFEKAIIQLKKNAGISAVLKIDPGSLKSFHSNQFLLY